MAFSASMGGAGTGAEMTRCAGCSAIIATDLAEFASINDWLPGWFSSSDDGLSA